MGHPQPNAERRYIEIQLGNRWDRMLSNSQIFNWFSDYVAEEAKIDRERIVKRLRVFSSRNEAPTVFWTILIANFYREGAHLGLRRYTEDGVTYHCPPQYFADLKAACKATSPYKHITHWVLRTDYLNGWIFAHVFAPGNNSWFKKNWPEALKLRGKRYLVSYYRFGDVDELLDTPEDELDEDILEYYQRSHSLLCLLFDTKSPAAFDITLDDFSSRTILDIINDPHLGSTATGFADAALQVAALFTERREIIAEGRLKQYLSKLLSDLKRSYSHLSLSMVEDADYMYSITYPLMHPSKKSTYTALMADFTTQMKSIIIENADELKNLAGRLVENTEDICLHTINNEPAPPTHYPVNIVRQYLANKEFQLCMPLDAFDALLELAKDVDAPPGDVIRVTPLKEIVRKRTKKLTDIIEDTGEFLVIAPLIVALEEVGHIYSEESLSDYKDLLFRTGTDRPWISTPAKFEGSTNRLEDARREFRAYCRIISGNQHA